MRVQPFIIISLFASFITSCGQMTKTESRDIEVKEITLYDTEDEVSPPPPHLTSNFTTLQDWLFNICDEEKPERSITTYVFGLFESPDNIICLVGVNQYNKGNTSHTRIE